MILYFNKKLKNKKQEVIGLAYIQKLYVSFPKS